MANGIVYSNQSKNYLEKLVSQGLNSFKAFSYQKITIDNTVKSLTIPDTAKYALMSVVSTVTSGVVAMYLETTQTTVSSTDGMPLRDGSVFDITDYANLEGFRVTQAQAGTHTLYVTYYR